MSLNLQRLYSRKFDKLLLFWWIVFFLFILTFSVTIIETGTVDHDVLAPLLVEESLAFAPVLLIISSLMFFEYRCFLEDLRGIQNPVCQEYVEKVSKNKILYFLGIPFSFFCFSFLNMIPITISLLKMKKTKPLADVSELENYKPYLITLPNNPT